MLQRYRIGRTDRDNLSTIKKTFNQGLCIIYQAQERRLTKLVGKFEFSIETIGVVQFYQARVNNVGIDKAIGVPFNALIDNQCIVQIGNIFYKIVRLQYKDDRSPKWWHITLQRSEFNYVDETE